VNRNVLSIVVAVSLVLSMFLLASLLPASAHDGVFIDVETCETLDFSSDLKYSYIAGEPVYARGKTQNYSETLDIYLEYDVPVWVNGQVAPERVPGTATTVTTRADGTFGPITIWASALPGKYDIFLDTNNNGRYNPEKDSVWSNNIEVTAGFFVLPEYPLGALIAIVSCFAAFLIIKRSNLTALKH